MELITINNQNINGEQVQTVNARELHEFLESKQQYSDWIKLRIEQFAFAENQDFTIHKIMNGKNWQTDYHISLDMAKELSMVERNEKGKQARKYFIECERRVKSFPALPQTFSEALRLAADLAEHNAALENKVIEDKPKVQFYEDVSHAINAITVRDAAKSLDTGEKRLFELLRNEGYLMANNEPYQRFIDMDLFRLVKKTYKNYRTGEDVIYSQTLITGKGMQYIHKKYFAELVTNFWQTHKIQEVNNYANQ